MSSVDEMQDRIRTLAAEKDVVIFAHNYMRPEVQDVAHVLGDSLALAKIARERPERTIIFCGVRFMAETAKILSPEKLVLHPRPDSKCPMAAMINPSMLRQLMEAHPDAATVAYVNTTAETKAMVDYCCTSANMSAVVRAVPQKKVIFVPDQNMAHYLKRMVREKEIITWPGYCPTHQKIGKETLMEIKRHHVDAPILVHPECPPEVIDIANEVLSTEGMVRFAREFEGEEIIIGTEKEMCHRLRKEAPHIKFHAPDIAVCPNMKKIELEDVLRTVEEMAPAVELSPELMEKALRPIERMVEIGRGPSG